MAIVTTFIILETNGNGNRKRNCVQYFISVVIKFLTLYKQWWSVQDYHFILDAAIN